MDAGVSLVRFLFVGFMAGWIATIAVRGPVRTRGCLTFLVVGMIGAVIGGFVFRLVGITGGAGFIGSVVTAAVGATLLLAIVRLMRTV